MKNRKTLMIVGALLVVALIIGYILVGRNSSTQVEDTRGNVLEVEPTIAMVDDSVEVSLEESTVKGELVLSVENVPVGTDLIEYQLTYNEVTKGPQGAIGKVDPGGEETEITLGTCSSGTCVYHEVDGPIELLLTFEGDYGQQKFEEE